MMTKELALRMSIEKWEHIVAEGTESGEYICGICEYQKEHRDHTLDYWNNSICETCPLYPAICSNSCELIYGSYTYSIYWKWRKVSHTDFPDTSRELAKAILSAIVSLKETWL